MIGDYLNCLESEHNLLESESNENYFGNELESDYDEVIDSEMKKLYGEPDQRLFAPEKDEEPCLFMYENDMILERQSIAFKRKHMTYIANFRLSILEDQSDIHLHELLDQPLVNVQPI